jgi:hypothetical protein
MIDLEKNTIDLNFFKKIIKTIKQTYNSDYKNSKELLDSLSYTQFESKSKLLEYIDLLGILNTDCHVSVLGCWFNSILGSILSSKVKNITGYDMDKSVVQMGKNIFRDRKNVDFYHLNVFETIKDRIEKTNLLINTSCEHMKPMKEWPFWNRIKPNTYLAFQSHNDKTIKDHINCVQSLEEFRNQLPSNIKILLEKELKETHRNGTRYTIIGKTI